MEHEDEDLLAKLDERDPWGWWYTTVTVMVFIDLTLIGLSFIFGPERWVTGNSISIIHHHSEWLPTVYYSIPFLVSAATLLWERTRLAAYMVALFFASFFIISSIALSLFNSTAPPSAVPGQASKSPNERLLIPLHSNIPVLGMSFLGILLLLAAMRHVVDERNTKKLKENAERALREL